MADTSVIFHGVAETLDEVAQKLKVESVLITRNTPTHLQIEGSAGPAEKIYKVGSAQRKGSVFEEQHELYCEYILNRGKAYLFVRDSRVDPQWDGNEDQVEFGLINYLGYPIRDARGYRFGTVCIMHTEPRDYSDDDKAVLQKLQREAEKALKLQTSGVYSPASTKLFAAISPQSSSPAPYPIDRFLGRRDFDQSLSPKTLT